MGAFPQTIHFIGSNKPRRMEVSVRDLDVEGEIPAEIDGAFFRAVPDNAHAPMFEDDIALNADGMVARFDIRKDAVDYDIRYVETDRYKAEKEARRALFGQYRNPFTDDPSVEGVDRTVANTTPVWHAGRLFMTKEDGLGHEINPHTLETVGKWTYGGVLKSETFTAHPGSTTRRASCSSSATRRAGCARPTSPIASPTSRASSSPNNGSSSPISPRSTIS